MRPIDLFYRIQRKATQILKLGHFNPNNERGRNAIANEVQRRAKQAVEKIEFTQKSRDISADSVASQSTSFQVNHNSSIYPDQADNLYREYNCFYNNPLSCQQPLETQKKVPQARFCSQCAFPVPIANKQEIRGRKGTYRIECFLGNRGKGRIYRGIKTNNRQPVVIKEYLLPNRSFTDAEHRKQRQQSFLQVSNLNTVDKISSDSRSILPIDAIADSSRNACYLITQDLAALPTLNSYLGEHGAMSAEQAIELLDQVLQTLEFLHGQKLQLSSGQIQQGLVHGNLNLNSVLIANREKQFFYYLCDLSIWEDLFDPTISQVSSPEMIDDLVALGYIGFYALIGRVIDPTTGVAIDPRNDQQWRSLDPNLKRFILQLLGLNSRFDNATAARTKLRYLALEDREQKNSFDDDESEAESKNTWLLGTIGVSLLLLLGLGGWLIGKNYWGKEQVTTVNGVRLTDKIEEVARVPSGNFNYGVTKPSTFVGNKLSEAVASNQPQLNLNYLVLENTATAIASIEPETLDFALVNSTSEGIIDNDRLIGQKVAYDGVLVFVPFDSSGGLAKYLEGKITVEQLRQLYTGQITSWQQLAKNAPNIPVKLFIPTETKAVEMFERLILQNADEIAQFQQLVAENKIVQLDSAATLRQIREDDRAKGTERVGGIAFGLVAQVYKQCNGYPLNIVRGDQQPPSLLVRNNANNDPVNLFSQIDCKEKSSYRLNEEIFRDRSYPLSFNLNVVYPHDNQYEIGEKIVEILKTKEAQCLIHNNNLIPLQSITDSDCS